MEGDWLNLIEAIIFDVDGTLYNETDVKMMTELSTIEYLHEHLKIDNELTYSTFREAKKQIMHEYKGRPEANDRNKWYCEMLKRLCIHNIVAEELCRIYWDVIYSNMNPYSDFVYVLPELQKMYKLFVLTDELLEIHKRKLKCLGLDYVFIKTFSAEKVGVTKPNQKIFGYAIDEIGIPKENILMVGDNPAADIKGGNLAGISTAWLKRGKYYYYQQIKDENPDIEFTNYIQLIGKIKSL